MGLYNPILGDIPQPEANSQQVFNPYLSKINYGALATTAPENEMLVVRNNIIFHIGAAEYSDTQVNILPFVVTSIQLKEHLNYNPGGAVNGIFKVYINGILIINHYQTANLDGTYLYNIPIANLTFNVGSRFTIICQRDGGAGGGVEFEAIFLGYRKVIL